MKVKTQTKLAKEEENGAKNGAVSKSQAKIKTKKKQKGEDGGIPSRDPATLILQSRYRNIKICSLIRIFLTFLSLKGLVSTQCTPCLWVRLVWA